MWRHCFNVRDVRSFDAIHDRYVYVRCRRGKHYLLTMANACLGLQDSIAVAAADDFNRVCSPSFVASTAKGGQMLGFS